MKKIGLIISLIVILFSCQDGDDAAFFNNTNETVIKINVPNSFRFDRLSIPVRVTFYDNPDYSGAITCTESLMMFEETEDNKKIPKTSISATFFNLLEPGDYYAFAYIDMNNNAMHDKNEPKKEFKKKVRTLKESRRTLSFNF
jgi:hypothetical protein